MFWWMYSPLLEMRVAHGTFSSYQPGSPFFLPGGRMRSRRTWSMVRWTPLVVSRWSTPSPWTSPPLPRLTPQVRTVWPFFFTTARCVLALMLTTWESPILKVRTVSRSPKTLSPIFRPAKWTLTVTVWRAFHGCLGRKTTEGSPLKDSPALSQRQAPSVGVVEEISMARSMAGLAFSGTALLNCTKTGIPVPTVSFWLGTTLFTRVAAVERVVRKALVAVTDLPLSDVAVADTW